MTTPGPRVLLALVAAATAVPAGAEWLRGYGQTLSGMTLAYHSPYPDITSALIVRASDGTSAAEWETEAVPDYWGGRPATFVWLAGLATGKGAHAFEFSIDGKPVLSFRTSADASRKEWRETGADGVTLSFKTVMVDQFDELFGFMWLDVPAALLRPGRPLRLKVAGEKAGSNDWVMTFRDDLRREVWARSEQALVREGGKPPQGDGQVRPAEADTEVVARVAEARARQEEHALGLHEFGGEVVDGRAGERQAREGDGARPGPDPDECLRALGEEGVEQRQVGFDDRARAGQHGLARPKRDEGQDLGRQRPPGHRFKLSRR